MSWNKLAAAYSQSEVTNPSSSTRRRFDDDFKTYVSTVLNRASSSVSVSNVKSSNKKRRVLQTTDTESVEVEFELLPTGSSNNLPLSQLQASLVSSSLTFAVDDVLSAEAVAICGNNVCEAGEAMDVLTGVAACARDCPYNSVACPTVDGRVCNDKGVCSAGVCSCNVLQGYGGEDCGTCAAGFVEVDGSCVKVSNEIAPVVSVIQAEAAAAVAAASSSDTAAPAAKV